MSDWRYLLDTNIVSDIVRDPAGVVYRRMALVGSQGLCTSVIVACELHYGAVKRRSARLRDQLGVILEKLPVLPFNGEAHLHYARIRADLEASGQPIGPNDLLIAAHAMSLGVTLVTHNVKEFDRIPGLRVEDWLA